MPSIRFAVPPLIGRPGPGGERRTFAVVVVRVDRSREGEAAIIGKRVRGKGEAEAGALLLVYGEDRDALDGRLLAHVAALYRIERSGLRRLDFGTFAGDWLAPCLASIEAAMSRPRARRASR
jgi:hypothetical protein